MEKLDSSAHDLKGKTGKLLKNQPVSSARLTRLKIGSKISQSYNSLFDFLQTVFEMVLLTVEDVQ